MKTKFYLLLLSFIFNFSLSAEERCFEQSGPVPFSYCLYEVAGSQNQDVLYYLHGINGNVRSWNHVTSFSHALYDQWKSQNQDPPTVVTFSFGPQWFLAQKNAGPASGLYEYTQAAVLPLLEKVTQHKSGRRMLMGISMGGVNTIQLGLKPEALQTVEFSKLAIICAQMSEVSPYSSTEELEKYLQQTQVYRYYLALNNTEVVRDRFYFAINVARAVWPSAEDFQSADPLVLARDFRPTNEVEVYVSAQVKDRYANFEANEVFTQLLRDNHVNVTWRPVWGEHCDLDLKSLADFIID